MPSKSPPVMGGPPTTKGNARLEQKLVLLDWLHHQLGYDDSTHLLRDTKETDEGYDEDGRSWISLHLQARAQKMPELSVEDLRRYDSNIGGHLARMNEGRVERGTEPLALRYFQYLAALYCEIYLDHFFNQRGELLRSLNKLVEARNAQSTASLQCTDFENRDLAKVALWMATGSGKTLLMHLNYRQFLHYKGGMPNNILLITPNEGLSQQHLEELHASGIPAMRFDFNRDDGRRTAAETVKVTEITKLVEEKRGGGKRVEVESFEDDNLIFVDEGHRGASGDTWRELRDKLQANRGFVFEYSATFGQAVAAAAKNKREGLLNEYGKSIAFDYSYRHFHEDGYGKDFSILNLREAAYEEDVDTLMMGNLLSFYEQQLLFGQENERLRPYNLARPLWMFVGGTVNATYSSDILTVVRYLQRVLLDSEWAVRTIKRLREGRSGLTFGTSGRDLFAGKFGYLREQESDAETTYRNALRRVMRTEGGGLELHDLRGCEGEIGMKSAGGEDYFGVVYIGSKGPFKRRVEEDGKGIAVGEDQLGGSLFEGINKPDSKIEILAGARKFMEGWNSWRVSNMGLLNIGAKEGSMIIQLFGRGVRLKGLEMSLKRSSALSGRDHPGDIGLLETLNIFALRANYMTRFREYLESEGIRAYETMDLPLFMPSRAEFKGKGLLIPRLAEGREFGCEETVMLKQEDGVGPVSVAMSTRVEQIASGAGGIEEVDAKSGRERVIPPASLALVDWEAVYLALLAYKESRNMGNLVVRPDLLPSIVKSGEAVYRLEAEQSVVEPRCYAERALLQEAVTRILRAYANALYRRRKARWETERLSYRELDDSDANFRFNLAEEEEGGKYIVSVPADNEALIEQIQALQEECAKLKKEESEELPRIHFDRHLYQPLLIEAEGVRSSPPGLKESERRFVADLRAYCAQPSAAKGAATLVEVELYLLRNLSRGKGVGFFDSAGFYPDFILWVKKEGMQRIVFVEPHGMLNAPAYAEDEKAQLHERLRALAEKLGRRWNGGHVELDSYIVSATRYDVLKKRYGEGDWTKAKFADKHILFQEREDGYDYIEQILQP